MAYTVLARRYRSQTFDDVVGQDAVAQTLKNAIKTGRVAHAYLFTGTRGVGKTTMARILAKALNCLNADGPTTTPCLKCDSCVSINLGEDIDVMEIDGASNTSVDDVRQLRQNAIYRPARARYKIYIIDEVHMLSTAAFNALLKILEEPPDHVKFIFATTEPNKVLPTIQSRCQRFDFTAIDPAVIGRQLAAILKAEKIAFEDDVIVALSRLANGSMRDGLSLLDQVISRGVEPLTVALLEEALGQPSRRKICELTEKIGRHDAAGVLNEIDTLLKTGQTAVQIVDALIDVMRDVIVIQTAGAKSDLLVLTADERTTLAALAGLFDTPGLIYAVTALEKIRWTIKNSDNPRALLEASMLRLALSEHFIGLERLFSQLQGAPTGALSPSKKNATPELRGSGATSAAPPREAQDPDPVSSPAPVITGELTADAIRQQWPAILQSLAPAIGLAAGFLENATVAAFANGVLKLQFPKTAALAMNMCQSRAETLEKAFTTALGQPIRLVFEASDSNAPAAAAPKPAAPGAKMDKTKRQKALSDPAVQLLLSGLDAKVTDIEELPTHTPEDAPDPDLPPDTPDA
ncbi:MAG TPA: DNA polymerase III subunit gamma/tau [Anaerohalosphaeraceae bacterium]|jgi:DNA polymerase-3 subunit gamma/tau|nr:DNA polymerase III subunit gamma/tau [Anaerohalosphaeraceae bacterium]HRT49775.1 DNA polymerase III subunit gamma/tau [Anaerohalosphaeraceae bacterium]HRT85565.1 DNA polymerase III subunit gamma/tau [Anaerohalosphaeraceae bacterium]